mmetsp:Transcript_11512/g.18107  ORF Transcript_11512/g.18107 Transcript_11512/m.18107 type:complete len:87 (+) Transcript_11512:389-649(+)
MAPVATHETAVFVGIEVIPGLSKMAGAEGMTIEAEEMTIEVAETVGVAKVAVAAVGGETKAGMVGMAEMVGVVMAGGPAIKGGDID